MLLMVGFSHSLFYLKDSQEITKGAQMLTCIALYAAIYKKKKYIIYSPLNMFLFPGMSLEYYWYIYEYNSILKTVAV